MNVCMFTNNYLPQIGGVARSVHSFCQDLCKLGHHVLVIAPTYAEHTEATILSFWEIRPCVPRGAESCLYFTPTRLFMRNIHIMCRFIPRS